MMKWNENGANLYGSPPTTSSMVNNGQSSPHSNPNATGSLYNNNNSSTVTSSQQSNSNATQQQQSATQQLQNSLSMLPQTCSGKVECCLLNVWVETKSGRFVWIIYVPVLFWWHGEAPISDEYRYYLVWSSRHSIAYFCRLFFAIFINAALI